MICIDEATAVHPKFVHKSHLQRTDQLTVSDAASSPPVPSECPYAAKYRYCATQAPIECCREMIGFRAARSGGRLDGSQNAGK